MSSQAETDRMGMASESDMMMSTRQVSPLGNSPPSVSTRIVRISYSPAGMVFAPDRSTPTTAPFPPLTSNALDRPPDPLTEPRNSSPSVVMPNWKPATGSVAAMYTNIVAPSFSTSRNTPQLPRGGTGNVGSPSGQFPHVAGQASSTRPTKSQKKAPPEQGKPLKVKVSESSHTGGSNGLSGVGPGAGGDGVGPGAGGDGEGGGEEGGGDGGGEEGGGDGGGEDGGGDGGGGLATGGLGVGPPQVP
mmetsp:Transcript_11682/g.42706  ORF Transcript_11682/g.42706 Transcript_11682/m.42706 type:complete len:246 (-) Transcript_11682:417-1154(-)